MTKLLPTEFLRDRGYEALLVLSAFGALSLRPTLRHAVELDTRIGKALSRRADLRQLQSRGLVEEAACKGGAILRLTELGRIALAGGRDPQQAWSRPWDGQWRLLTFDLPRRETQARARFWRWLRRNHFGRLQGSVWIHPDPLPEIESLAREMGFDPGLMVVFTGQVEGTRKPAEMVAGAWNLDAANESYRTYTSFALRVRKQLRKGPLQKDRMKEVLQEDRKRWWDAVRRDPLLPRELLPAGYGGMEAWKVRQALHGALAPPAGSG
ncbi:MAG: hypothetical protein HKN82_12625 [Akkermansiaceae bacterium]|nr:hypothetical protein [Akkermansiaceae bacterium]NNM28092.1 hypothetical protein [Akkermansiaceae bacterium]